MIKGLDADPDVLLREHQAHPMTMRTQTSTEQRNL